MEVISSPSNQTIKYVKSLYIKKHRETNKEFVVEGLRFSKEAFESGWDISKVILSESFYNKSGSIFNLTPLVISDKLFVEITETENPQGIMVIVKMQEPGQIPDDARRLVVLDCIQDPGNMGTIIRTADAFAIDGIVVSDGCVDIYNSKVLRATMGSIFHIPVYSLGSTEDVVSDLKNIDYKVYALHLNGELLDRKLDNRKLRNDGKTAVIIGNEANGINEKIAEMVDYLVKIPMPGRAESLNASVAAAIIMYEMS